MEASLFHSATGEAESQARHQSSHCCFLSTPLVYDSFLQFWRPAQRRSPRRGSGDRDELRARGWKTDSGGGRVQPCGSTTSHLIVFAQNPAGRLNKSPCRKASAVSRWPLIGCRSLPFAGNKRRPVQKTSQRGHRRSESVVARNTPGTSGTLTKVLPCVCV